MKRWSLLAVLVGAVVLSWWAGCSNPNLAGGKLHFDQASRLEGPDRTARFERALETFRKAVTELPKSGEARLWLGRTYAELDRPDSAAANFDRVVEIDPLLAKDVKDVRDHYWSIKYNGGLSSAGAAMKSRKDGDEAAAKAGYRDALRQFLKASVYSADHALTYTMIGKVYLNLASVDSAVVMLKRAREIAPDDEKVKSNLFSVYREEADKAFEKGAREVEKSDSVAALGHYHEALRLYTEADAILPGNYYVNFQLGVAAGELAQLEPERRQELLDEAINRYKGVLKENPAEVDVLYNLALVYRDLERHTEARDLALRLVDLRPREGTYRSILGQIENKLGNKQAYVNGIVFGRALKSGTDVDVSQTQERANKFGPGTDIRRRFLENGPPEQIQVFSDTQGQEYEIWFYWKRGQGFAFLEGKETASSQFAPDGVLTLTKGEVATKGASKVIVGSVANGSSRKYAYVRAEFDLLDEQGEAISHVAASTDKLDPRGTWNFEIPLTGDQEQALSVKSTGVAGY